MYYLYFYFLKLLGNRFVNYMWKFSHCKLKNPAYERHWISWHVRIIALVIFFKHFLLAEEIFLGLRGSVICVATSVITLVPCEESTAIATVCCFFKLGFAYSSPRERELPSISPPWTIYWDVSYFLWFIYICL